MRSEGRREIYNISEEEVFKTLKKMKSCTVQLIILKNGGKIMIKWFKRLINMCLNNGEDIQDGNVPYATSIFEEKGDRINCTSNRGIICLTFHGKGKGNQLSYKKNGGEAVV